MSLFTVLTHLGTCHCVLYADAVYYQTENSIGPITSFTSTCIFLVYLVAFGQTVTKYAGSYQYYCKFANKMLSCSRIKKSSL